MPAGAAWGAGAGSRGHERLARGCDRVLRLEGGQLHVLGESIGVPVHSDRERKNAAQIVKLGLRRAKDNKCDCLIVDTAGRLHIDETLMDELRQLDWLPRPWRNRLERHKRALERLRAQKGAEPNDEELAGDEVVRTERVILEGWAMAAEGGVTVAFDPTLDDELIREGAALELIRALNEQRKQEGLELTDRIELRRPDAVDELGQWVRFARRASLLKRDEAPRGGEPDASTPAAHITVAAVIRFSSPPCRKVTPLSSTSVTIAPVSTATPSLTRERRARSDKLLG